MKQIKIIFFLLLTICSCSNNDDDNSCSSDFLECYDGTNWTFEDNQDAFYRFSNNLKRPIESWNLCVPPIEGYSYYDFPNIELIENTKGRLKFKQIVNYAEFTFTFVTDENQLTLIPPWPGGIGHLIETSIEVYNLQGCN